MGTYLGKTPIGAIVPMSYKYVEQITAEGTACVELKELLSLPLRDVQIKGNSIQRLLPDAYQEVEYIESSGTQYIDTGFTPNQDTRVIVDFQLTKLTSAFICGAREHASSNAYTLNMGLVSGKCQLRSIYGSQMHMLSGDFQTERCVIDKNGAVVYMNNEYKVTHSSTDFTAPGSLYIFACNQANTAGGYLPDEMRLYSFKMYDNGTLIRNYVPCYRTADSVAGLYDIVNDKFYTNAGTGTFVVGADYETSPNIEQPIEIQSVGDKTLNLLNPNAKLEDIKAYHGINLTGIDKKYGLLIKLKEGKTVPSGTFFGLARYVTESSSATASWVVSNGSLVKAFGDGQTYAFLSFNPSGNWLAGLACFPKTQEAWDSLMDAFEILWVEGDYKLDTMPEYEPYGYKIPINLLGKNLVNVSSDKNTYGYLDANGNIVSHSAIKYTDFIGVGNATQITFSGMGSNGMSAPATCFYDENKSFISGIAFGGVGEKTIDIPENAKYFRTCFRTSYTEFMVEFGSVATGYVEYIELTTNIYLKEPLRKINDVVDVLDYKNKKVIRNVGSIIYNATESWSRYDSGNGYMESNTIFIDGKPVLCNMFVNSQTLIKTLAIRKNYANVYVYGVQDYYPTQADWHAFLAENNMEVIGQLVTPTEETFDINTITLREGCDMLCVDTEVEPSNLKVIYLIDADV